MLSAVLMKPSAAGMIDFICRGGSELHDSTWSSQAEGNGLQRRKLTESGNRASWDVPVCWISQVEECEITAEGQRGNHHSFMPSLLASISMDDFFGGRRGSGHMLTPL